MRFVLFLTFLVVPILEIWVLIQVGEVIGGWPTVALLLADSLLGAWIVRREGRRAWRNLQAALSGGRMPERELADAALIVAGGTLLLTPGFLTDLLGFLCILPFTRPVARRLGAWFFAQRMRTLARTAAGPGVGSPFGPLGSPFGPAGSPFDAAGSPFDAAGSPFGAAGGGGTPGSGPVIHGEVIRDDPATPDAPDDRGGSARSLGGR
ncbi:UPF0716 protein FxsA [Streptosporangium becharense]|uniref:UPF0716 protein FxsA n=1 Tax=Streptosporangium becharense TaxID=1816182 RepID=A0A7W9IBQ1_9ACTN|nr:FxsA family protein [Streptosporangium becharense]MBB2913706.1 UPF0716 protein FxsA [Streptosporangium becharense]MBB5817787.1 UPF0716 protein FxsA [Streptosporangium becharense]